MFCSTTLESTFYITTTNSQGQQTTTAPSIVTEVTTSTDAAGAPTTITVAVANPTLEPNNGTSSDSTFFRNTGAVVGVFVVVGLAAASIVLWIFFYIRRKSRMRRIDRDTEVEAAVAAAGYGRALLDDDNNDRGARSPPHSSSQYSTQMGQRGGPPVYIPGGPVRSVSGVVFDDDNAAFNPYAGYAAEARPSAVGIGYVQARTASPPPGAGLSGPGTDDMGDSSRDRKSSYGHTHSVGSYEPLLAAYTQGSSAERGANVPPTPPPRNPRRLIDASPDNRPNVSSLPGNSSDGSADDRLDPDIRRRTRSDSLDSDKLRDDEDYSRPVLTVRNMPDSRSTHSAL
ncbi:hypothetical protein K503DRAFT_679353 [Rhizopogon vinicolor AM-OR11-026]|uniref:Uncharacterized protein n=1 Tax=Rhizopogon vinicolor AM-OR11-026 TaxID=1314800 RepID=A0A1B7NHB0_9AGAM|nr:hypothetical protein K503DRAFT_679353 [Rhizopogon vinicolor AM-OR11-026]